MALADRFYMRDSYHAPRVTTALIIVLIAAFLVQSLLLFYFDVQLTRHLALSVEGLRQGKIWQLITFQFLHLAPWPWHVLINCLGLYFFGRPVEEIVGSRKFVALYFLSGIVGGLLQVAVTATLPRHFDLQVVGASAGVCGMIAIFCSINPMEELTTWLYFLPITIRARWFLIFLTGFSIFGTLIPFSGLAHGAHLGGILTGLAYVRFGRRFWDNAGWSWPRLSRPGAPRPGTLAKGTRRLRPRSLPARETLSQEVDRILDKISAQGLDSLTDKERKLLETAREKMR